MTSLIYLWDILGFVSVTETERDGLVKHKLLSSAFPHISLITDILLIIFLYILGASYSAVSDRINQTINK